MRRILPVALSIIVIVVLGALGAATISVLQPKPEQAEEVFGGLSVFTEPVARDDLTFTVTAQGEVRPRREINVSPQISGLVSFVSPDFIDGGFIRKGQVLVRLEAADYELAVVRAKSGVASAQQRLAREQAEAEIAQQDLINLGITDSSPLARREPQLAEAQAGLDSAKAQLADAELALSRTAVVAPFDGRVRDEMVDVGQFASPGQSLGRIFATDVVEVVLPITDEELGRLALPLAFAETSATPGPAVIFRANVGGQPRTWRGRVTRTAAAVNAQTRLINMIAELDDPFGVGADDGAPMAPGLFVQADIDGVSVDGLLKAPRSAIRSGNNIFIGDPVESVLRIIPVDMVYSDQSGAWFRSDRVEVGALAVTSPLRGPNDGMTITILERLEDGTIKNHTEDNRVEESEIESTETLKAMVPGSEEKGTE
ncbi:MAG: efflux RND transporter periplasmic adaptor subunit [Pseudomonadota bacterium]